VGIQLARTGAEVLGQQHSQPITDAKEVVVPMLERFIATDRGFKGRRNSS
jgi:hypothetical protein